MTESLFDDFEEPKPKKKTAFKADAKRKQRVAAPPITVAPTTPAVFKKREAPRDWAFEDAIKAIAPLLHPSELPQFEAILNPPRRQRLREAGIEWRRRNGLDG